MITNWQAIYIYIIGFVILIDTFKEKIYKLYEGNSMGKLNYHHN